MVVLQSSYTNNITTLHVNQMPPNPAIFASGPALLAIVKDIPSIGVHVMIGSGHIEEQKPLSSIIEVVPSDSPNADANEELKKLGALGLAERRPGAVCLWVALWTAVLALFSGGPARLWVLYQVSKTSDLFCSTWFWGLRIASLQK